MKIIAFALFAYLYIAVIIFAYTLIRNPQELDYKRTPMLFPVFIGVLIALWIVLSTGIEKFLFAPIPYSWGWHDGEGAWTSTRRYLSWIIALIVAIYIFWLIGEVQRKEEVIKKLQSRYQRLNDKN